MGDHSYCRNPTKGRGVWCYTDQPQKKRWEYCPVPVCQEISKKILFYIPPPDLYAPKNSTTGKKYSIVIFIIDALSQLNALRSLPLTLANAEALGGTLFRGHHKVGLNSLPNVMGMLTGSSNLTDKPWIGQNQARKFDWQPLVTNLFHDEGWTTMLVHGAMGTVLGSAHVFNRAPDPFDIQYHDGFRLSKKWGRNHSNPTNLLRDFSVMYRDRPTFLHVHLSEYTHNDLNGAKLYDRDLDQKLRELSDSGALEDTFFFLMGDHGYRFGAFSKTIQGNIENNMPLLMVIPPTSLAEDQPELSRNLRQNSGLLTSLWDLHQTLKHVLALGVGQDKVDDFYRGFLNPGSSLLKPLEPRTCSEANISLWFCSCPEDHVALEPEDVRALLEAVLEDMNVFLQPLELGCQKLEISSSAHQNPVTNPSMMFEGDNVEIEAFVETKVREAHFQVKIFLSGSSGEVEVSLTRLDQYSLTSECVPENGDSVRPYCVCSKPK